MEDNYLIVFKVRASRKDGPIQPDWLKGTKLTTCNAESPLGKCLLESDDRVFLVVKGKDLNYANRDQIKGVLHYGEFVQIDTEFKSLKELKFFMKNITMNRLFKPLFD